MSYTDMYFCASYSSPISKMEILLSYIRPNNYDGRKLFFKKKITSLCIVA